MSFKISELSAFSNAKLGTSDDAIANLGRNAGKIIEKGMYRGFLCSIFRMPGTKKANNAVRTELLRALGKAFGLEGIGNNNAGKTTFSAAFMDKLAALLGDDFKREDFGIEDDGTVKSGKPLTQRRIKAILRRATLVGRSDIDDYDCKATQVKYDYVADKVKSLPENDPIRVRLDSVQRVMEFVQNELPNLISDNYLFDPDKPYDMHNLPGKLRKKDSKGNTTLVPLLEINQVREYLQERLGEHIHINENIIYGKNNAVISDLRDPRREIMDYVGKVLKTYVSFSLDMFIDAEAKGLEDKYSNALYGVCLEAKTNHLTNFKCRYLMESEESVITYDKSMPLQDCIGLEIQLQIEDEPDDSKKTWAHVAQRVKDALVGSVRPICTAEVKKDDDGDIVSVKFKPVLDNENRPVVRAVTAKDIDAIGEAVMARIIDGV